MWMTQMRIEDHKKALKMSNIIIKVVLVQLKQFSTEESSMKHK